MHVISQHIDLNKKKTKYISRNIHICGEERVKWLAQLKNNRKFNSIFRINERFCVHIELVLIWQVRLYACSACLVHTVFGAHSSSSIVDTFFFRILQELRSTCCVYVPYCFLHYTCFFVFFYHVPMPQHCMLCRMFMFPVSVSLSNCVRMPTASISVYVRMYENATYILHYSNSALIKL